MEKATAETVFNAEDLRIIRAALTVYQTWLESAINGIKNQRIPDGGLDYFAGEKGKVGAVIRKVGR